ncbi:MAG: hypothetical protein AUH30_00950 [Candidatus Rokubacteria bacterium 13_1_40CM_68_15]|nr:MAG: hypothetical protein AUH30_00950 [Candidatus Rokubacteria bacterium 13_1_40CM_68_15]
MKLASKIFLGSALVMLVLVGVGILSLRAVGHLAAVNRDITMRVLPTLGRAAAAHDAVLGLVRLETRFLVLGDARYAALWDERAARVREDLAALRPLVRTAREQAVLEVAAGAFARYEAAVREERRLLKQRQRAEAIRLAETEARTLADQVGQSLEDLMAATHRGAEEARADAAQLEQRTWTGVLVALGCALALGLGATAVLAQRLTRRLRVLSEATAAVAAGSFREPIPERGVDEVAALAHSFNAMAAKLRQLDQLKESFLATVSHELRSPLTSMREAAHLLHEEVAGTLNPKQARLVAIIGESTERLLRLVNQILDLSRLRAGRLPLARRTLDLVQVAERGVNELRPQAAEGHVAVAVERIGQNFEAAVDEDKLVQVVINLVANSIRFTPGGGRVIVRVVDAGPEVELHVEDTGIGIPAVALPRIFEMYQQAHGQRGGTGLGLAIVRGVVEAHGGRVTVESQEGKGSRFTVLLPRRRAEA